MAEDGGPLDPVNGLFFCVSNHVSMHIYTKETENSNKEKKKKARLTSLEEWIQVAEVPMGSSPTYAAGKPFDLALAWSEQP